MPSYNKVFLIGNLTRDVEIKYLQSGVPIARFGMAMNDSYTDKNTGEKKDVPCFVEIEAWDRQAEVCNEYLKKGQQVFVEGVLKFDSWETPEGVKRNRLYVRIYRMQILGSKNGNQESAPQQTQQTELPPPTPTQVSESEQQTPTTDDDIPF